MTWVLALAVAGALIRTGMWIGAVNADRHSFKASLEEIRKDIKKILKRLPSRVVEGASPVRLTELGRKISRCIGAESIVPDLAERLQERAADMEEYEVYELCDMHIKSEYAPPEDVAAKIRKCAYDNGIDSEEVLDVLVVELRDLILKRRSSA